MTQLTLKQCRLASKPVAPSFRMLRKSVDWRQVAAPGINSQQRSSIILVPAPSSSNGQAPSEALPSCQQLLSYLMLNMKSMATKEVKHAVALAPRHMEKQRRWG